MRPARFAPFAVEFAISSAEFLVRPVSSSTPFRRFPVALPAGFGARTILARVLPMGFKLRSDTAIDHVIPACRVIAVSVLGPFGAEHGLMGGLYRNSIKRCDALAGRLLQLIN